MKSGEPLDAAALAAITGGAARPVWTPPPGHGDPWETAAARPTPSKERR